MRSIRGGVWAFVILASLLRPTALQACATCFGNSDSQMAQGMNAGIFVLLGFVFGFWILFGCFFVFLARRARQAGSSVPGVVDDPHHS